MNDLTTAGNDAALFALRDVRRYVNMCRISGPGILSDWYRGFAQGQLLVAQHDMRADPVVVQAVENEVEFLCNDYSRRRP